MPAYVTATVGPEYSGIGDLACPSCGTKPGSTHAINKQHIGSRQNKCRTLPTNRYIFLLCQYIHIRMAQRTPQKYSMISPHALKMSLYLVQTNLHLCDYGVSLNTFVHLKNVSNP